MVNIKQVFIMEEEKTVGENKLFVKSFSPETKEHESPIVLVHGSFGGYWMWNKIRRYLVESGLEVHALSLRGHKPSAEVDLGKLSMTDYRDDILEVVKELGLEKPVVIGHSMGGLVTLMYGAEHPVYAIISISPSPSAEVQEEIPEEEIQKIPDIYNVSEAGMPENFEKIQEALPDVEPETLKNMRQILAPESGSARRDRKRGISIPKDKVNFPLLFIGAELGDSLPFGISAESTKNMAEYYSADLTEVQDASHPGILVGEHAEEAAQKIKEWLL